MKKIIIAIALNCCLLTICSSTIFKETPKKNSMNQIKESIIEKVKELHTRINRLIQQCAQKNIAIAQEIEAITNGNTNSYIAGNKETLCNTEKELDELIKKIASLEKSLASCTT